MGRHYVFMLILEFFYLDRMPVCGRLYDKGVEEEQSKVKSRKAPRLVDQCSVEFKEKRKEHGRESREIVLRLVEGQATGVTV